MRRSLALLSLLVFIAAGCAMSGCGAGAADKALKCRWTIITMQGGVSVVTGGNPADKTVKDLFRSGIGFTHKVEREMQCVRDGAEPPASEEESDNDPTNKDLKWAQATNE